MSYNIRTSGGLLFMTVPNEFASTIIHNAKGHFRPYTVKGKPQVTVFELDDDYVYTKDGSLKIYLWKGTLLIPKSGD